jgi:hypothetical protein
MVKQIQLGGFMSHQFANASGGKKFRSQVRRRAQGMAEDGSSVEIRDDNGRLVDCGMGEAERSSYLRPTPRSRAIEDALSSDRAAVDAWLDAPEDGSDYA